MQLTDATVVKNLDIASLKPGSLNRFWVHVTSNGLGLPIYVPVLIAKGKHPGKTLGITAAVHGNELNGIPVIQRLFKEIDREDLHGTIVGVPVVNVLSFLSKKRRFTDGKDLNHIMPGVYNGNASEVFSYRVFDRIIKHFDFLVDLHTASAGRINSYYIRADMDDPFTAKMARLQNAQIIVHNPPSDGTLRGAAEEADIPAITLEVGDPNTFQKGMIRSGLTGIYNLLSYLEMTTGTIEEANDTILCSHSYWIYTDRGGLLQVLPKVTDVVDKGDLIAVLNNVFGDRIREYLAPEKGVVIGKSVSPVNQTGGRILHLGIIEKTL